MGIICVKKRGSLIAEVKAHWCISVFRQDPEVSPTEKRIHTCRQNRLVKVVVIECWSYLLHCLYFLSEIGSKNHK
jgi:hypothetical protein